MTRLYTRNGDDGETFLLFGEKVSKNDKRVECYGVLDECISVLGVSNSIILEEKKSDVSEIIINIQRKLFIVSSEIACPKSKYFEMKKKYKFITKEMILEIEKFIDKFQDRTPKINYFVLPGNSLSSSYIDVARTICRRAERLCVDLKNNNNLNNKNNLIILNRLSDLLFIIARYIDRDKEYLKATE